MYPIRAVDASIVEPPVGDGGGDGSAGDLRGDKVDAGGPPLPISCAASLVGFGATPGVSTPGGTTGGGNVQPVTVTTLADLLLYANTNDTAQVIQIGAVIQLNEQVRVKSNKTIRGTAQGGLVGSGLLIDHANNVIVQNLTIAKAVGTDAIGIQYAQNVWVDHCDLSSELTSPKGTYDGLVDITHGSINVTVSWNVFHDHYNVSVVGHTATPTLPNEDLGALTITYHHNWFARTPNNCPRVRFGTVHVFNNLYEDVEGAVASQESAQVLVENNIFRRVLHPIFTRYEDPHDGFATEINNVFDPPGHPPEITMAATWRPTYAYKPPDVTEWVEAIVTTCAGPGH